MAQDKDSKNLNVPPLRFPGFTDEWKNVTFKEVVTLQRGSSPRPIVNYITHDDSGLNWIRIGDMSSIGRIVTQTEEKITVVGALKSRHVNIGDLILSNSMSFGQPYIMGIEGYIHDGWFVLKNFEKHIERDFLCNLLIAPIIQKQYAKLAAGGVVQNISSELVNSVKFSIPIFSEQKKIVSLLNAIDERIATQNKIIDNLQSLIKGLAKTHYDNCHRLYFVKIRNLGKSYTVMNLSKEQLSDCGRPCILYGELFTQYGPIIDEIVSKTNVTGNLTLSSGRDLLFPSSTTVDALSLIAPSALTKSNIILAGDMFGIKVSDEYSPEYLSYYFNYIGMRDLAKYAIGSTIIHLHYKDIAEYTIKIPSINEQKAFVKLASFVKRKIDVEKNLLHNLTELKTYLLQKLFI